MIRENQDSIQTWNHLGDVVGWKYILGRWISRTHHPWSYLASLLYSFAFMEIGNHVKRLLNLSS